MSVNYSGGYTPNPSVWPIIYRIRAFDAAVEKRKEKARERMEKLKAEGKEHLLPKVIYL